MIPSRERNGRSSAAYLWQLRHVIDNIFCFSNLQTPMLHNMHTKLVQFESNRSQPAKMRFEAFSLWMSDFGMYFHVVSCIRCTIYIEITMQNFKFVNVQDTEIFKFKKRSVSCFAQYILVGSCCWLKFLCPTSSSFHL